ncbi:hypothetical protein [Xanthomonas sacchari]|uniref:hypothetical protein n=1 Tax=Xanthomonas sacchari TaxID=56458 RepID=UPI002259BD46
MSYTHDDEGVTTHQPPSLLEQVRGRLRLRHDSLRTEQMSVGWMGRFILVNGERHSTRMGQAAQILRMCRGVQKSSIAVGVCGHASGLKSLPQCSTWTP